MEPSSRRELIPVLGAGVLPAAGCFAAFFDAALHPFEPSLAAFFEDWALYELFALGTLLLLASTLESGLFGKLMALLVGCPVLGLLVFAFAGQDLAWVLVGTVGFVLVRVPGYLLTSPRSRRALDGMRIGLLQLPVLAAAVICGLVFVGVVDPLPARGADHPDPTEHEHIYARFVALATGGFYYLGSAAVGGWWRTHIVEE